MNMIFFKKILKKLKTRERFIKIYEKLEDEGFSIFLNLAGKSKDDFDAKFKRRANNFIKNTNKLNKLYSKWKKN